MLRNLGLIIAKLGAQSAQLLTYCLLLVVANASRFCRNGRINPTCSA